MPRPLTVWSTTNWKILRDRNTRPPYLPPEKSVCRSRSNRTGHGTTDWFHTGKGVHQRCILLPSLFNLNAEYITWNADLDEAQAGIKTARRNINNLRHADDTTLNGRKQRRTKELLDEREREWKRWLKTQHSENWHHGIWSHHFMANRWGNSGNSDRFYFGGLPKSLQMVTVAMKLKDTCSLEEKLWPI